MSSFPKIAITGASGFIGSHILRECDTRGILPTLTVRSKKNLADKFFNYPVVELDIYNPPANCFELLGAPDILIHLAWGGLPNYRSLHHFEKELPAHYTFLKTMAQRGLKNLCVVGTCFEYGMQSGVLSESMETRPDNPYGYAKDQLRRQLQFLQKELSFNLIWARLFYLYGEGQAKNSLFPLLKSAVQQSDSQFNMSAGEQIRDYLPAEKVASAIIELALRQKNVGIVNVCSGQPVSVRRLVESWLRDNNWNISLNLGYYPYPDYEPLAFWGDNTKLKQIICP